MDKTRESNRNVADLVPVQPAGEVTVMPPNSGVVGRFLKQTEDMFKARAMRMSGLLRRINESGQRTESLLRNVCGTYGSSRDCPGATAPERRVFNGIRERYRCRD